MSGNRGEHGEFSTRDETGRDVWNSNDEAWKTTGKWWFKAILF